MSENETFSPKTSNIITVSSIVSALKPYPPLTNSLLGLALKIFVAVISSFVESSQTKTYNQF